MQELTISLSENVLKISTVEKGEFKGVSAEISPEVVHDYRIVNLQDFAAAVQDLIGNVTHRSAGSLLLNFVIEPHDVYLNFITINKNDGPFEEQITKEISSKIKDVSLDEMYFSHLKVAPFVFQFIGIKKEVLDQYLELSDLLGMSLKSAMPWIMLLPKFVETNEPAIFISKLSGGQFVALSEFGGIFFSNVYKKDKSTKELQETVEDLSVFKRTDPISKVYLYNYDNFSLSPEFNILQLEIPNSDLEEASGYEIHLLIDHMVKKDKSLLSSQINLLNILPVPVTVNHKNKALVPITVSIAALVLLGGGLFLLNSNRTREVLESTASNNEVLSEETTTSDPQVETSKEEETEETQESLLREDISVRIYNGAGIQGVAGRTQEFMEGLGYGVESIGNADSIGRADTLLRFKSDKAQYADLLKEDMQDFFTVTVESDLEESEPYDVLIIVGTDAEI